MGRYNTERSPQAIAFLQELVLVCRKHNLSLSHEDGHGGFLVENYNEDYTEWLCAAADETTHTVPTTETVKAKLKDVTE